MKTTRKNTFFDSFFDEIQYEFEKMFYNSFFWDYLNRDSPFLLESNNKKSSNELVNSTNKPIRKPIMGFDDTEKEYIANIELPGIKKDEIELNIKKDTIEIKAEHKKQENKENQSISYQTNFYRCMSLPENSDENNISANYENGILKLNIPKKEISSSEIKKIEIK